MAALHVFLFGGIRVSRCSDQSPIKLTQTSKIILAYLLLNRHRKHSREILSDLFWNNSNQERARRCLNTALWRLRRVIEMEDTVTPFLMVSETGDVGFNVASDYWLDVAVFEECINRIKSKPFDQVQPMEVQELESKNQLYVGDLLEGIYTDWAISAREYGRLLYLDGLKFLMGYYRYQNDHLLSLEYGKNILEMDPLREDIHREMMRLFLVLGQRASAIHQYELCCQNLSVELGIAPLEETQQLYKEIMMQGSDSQPTSTRGAPFELKEAIIYMQQAAHSFELAQEQFQKAMHRMQRFSRQQSKRSQK